MENELEKNVENTENKGSENKPEPNNLEARIKALESENAKLRQANTNASADASKWKKQYQEMLPEKERLEKEQEERNAAMQKELDELKAERNVANYKSQLTAPDIGFDAALAQEVAVSLNSGDVAKVFDGLRKFIEAHDKQLRENAFRSNPTLQGGNSTKAITREQFEKMGYTDRLKVYNEHPDLYNEYTQ